MRPAPAFTPDLDDWQAWSPAQVGERFGRCDAAWYITGGWAIDLFLGRQTREHEDIEIGVPAAQFERLLPALTDCDCFVVDDGWAVRWADADAALRASTRQTWVRERVSGAWRLDIFRQATPNGDWIYRRDPRIGMPHDTLILHDASGLPFARPEAVLLLKARGQREKDKQDFAQLLPRLDRAAKAWLRDALALGRVNTTSRQSG